MSKIDTAKTITLTVSGNDIRFAPTEDDYTAYMNELMPDNKVAPAHNFCMRTVLAEDKTTLKAVIGNNPSAALQISAAVQAEYAPQLEIKVKKSAAS